MAALILSSTDRLTAAEIAKRSANNISQDERRILELMNETNEWLNDAPYDEANDGTANTTVVRTSLPKGSHRYYNQGVKTEASQTDTIHDITETIESYSVVDKMLVDDSPNPSETRMSEEIAFIEGLAQTMSDDFIYGNNATNKAQINGLATRRNKVDGKQCISFNGSNANKQTSVYLVMWGKDKVKLIYPRGAKGLGTKVEDKGAITETFNDGTKMEAYQTHYINRFGVAVRNPKALIRICNIDMNSEMSADTKMALVKKIIAAKAYLPSGNGTISILCNQEIKSILDEATMDKSNVIYPMTDPWGKEVEIIRQMRIRRCDAILNTEAVVS